jgi:cytochrome c
LLAQKIIKGGSGNWGETAMSAHPQISQSDAEEITRYLFENFGTNKKNQLPATGAFQPNITEREYLLSASYTDKGNAKAKAITKTEYRLLRWPELYVAYFDEAKLVSSLNDGEIRITQSGGYFKFNQLDLTDVAKITYTLLAPAQGTLELRLDSVSGPVAATIDLNSIEVKPRNWGTGSTVLNATGLHDCYLVFKAAESKVVDLVRIKFEVDR